MTSDQIANTLFISPHTVLTHRKNLMIKLDAKNSVGMYKRGLERGLIALPSIHNDVCYLIPRLKRPG